MTAPDDTATVPADLDGARVDVAAARLFDVSRSRAARWLRDGRVTLDGASVAPSTRVMAGNVLGRRAEPAPVADGQGRDLPDVRYRDAHLLVVAKPPDLVVHPGTGNRAGTLVQVLVDHGIQLAERGGPGRPGVVHRLDKDTSGLLVLASTDEAHAGLVAALRARTVLRRYLALVEGALPAEHGRVEAPIGRDRAHRVRFAAIPDGRPAVTHWRVRASGRADDAPVQLVACRLETGRTHQIRVHLSHAGTPVAGDLLYGARARVADALGLTRPFLHAASLAFDHPVTGRPLAFAEPLPADLARAAARAGIPPEATVPDAG